MRELEIILRDYLTMNAEKMSYQDLEEFDSNVFDIETPSLNRYLVNEDEVEEHHKNKYVKILVEYVEARKKDYQANVPVTGESIR